MGTYGQYGLITIKATTDNIVNVMSILVWTYASINSKINEKAIIQDLDANILVLVNSDI